MRLKFIWVCLLFVGLYSAVFAQNTLVTLSGIVKDKTTKEPLAYVNVVLKGEKDSAFVTGTVTNEEGRFTLLSIKSDNYILELSYKISDCQKLSFFYNRRVDRPNEVDIRIFPKYEDAEIIKVGNSALRPQYPTSFEVGYKASHSKGYIYGSGFATPARTITKHR